ncbi:MAG: hypothetical protein BGO29_04280 [Bacteroidales bacterium 36-12]|nr:MAG: hypothetical protein BGO29_04280 [Bacteroidales bacterium 36-12]
MKLQNIKIILASLLVLVSIHVVAEDKQTRETPILPKAGDIGLGIDLVPVLDYVGNMFNGNTFNSLNSFGGEPVLIAGPFAPNLAIRGKYMYTDNMALRLSFATLGRTYNQKLYIRDDAAFFHDPLSEAKLIDVYKHHRTGMEIALGSEWRRGYNRIQGYAGADLIFGFERTTDTYEYANLITEINQTPSRTAGLFNVPPTPIAVPYWTQAYVTGRYHDGNNLFVGLGAVVGVEYFISSHLSLGGEVSLYALQMFSRQSYQEQEGFNTLTNKVEKRTELLSPGSNGFAFGTDNLGGKLYMMFYF